MYNGYARTQDETARNVVTQRSYVEMELERAQAAVPEPPRQTSRADLQPHCMATEAAPYLVSPGANSHHQQRERRKNRIVGMIAALACFGLCWMTAPLIAEAVGDELLGAWWGKSIGIGPGWLYIRMAQATALPAARRGALWGWITRISCPYHVACMVHNRRSMENKNKPRKPLPAEGLSVLCALLHMPGTPTNAPLSGRCTD